MSHPRLPEFTLRAGACREGRLSRDLMQARHHVTAILVDMSSLIPADILTHYQLAQPVDTCLLEGSGVNNQTLGVRAGERSYILKRFLTGVGTVAVEYEMALLHWLGEQTLSFSTPVPIPTQTGALLLKQAGRLYALFPLLPGRQPDGRHLCQVEAVGAAMGELHLTLAECPLGHHPVLPGHDRLSDVHPAIPEPGKLNPAEFGIEVAGDAAKLCAWWSVEIAKLEKFARDKYPLLPYQVIHGDFVPFNTLCIGNRVTAVLDFEFSTHDARAIDVAAALASVMRLWGDEVDWDTGKALLAGYGHYVRLSDAELQALPLLIRLREAVAAIWWLGRELSGPQRQPSLRRLERVQHVAEWLEQGGERLIGMAADHTAAR